MIGIDEVGRGALAGPLLVVAAKRSGSWPQGLADSKLLTRRQREDLFELLVGSFNFGEGWVTPTEIDRLGLGACLRLGVVRALKNLNAGCDEEIIIDGSVNYIPKKFKLGRCEIDADAHIPIVSAASIYAKVRRDRFMWELSKRHRRFSFDQHVGYGTSQHRDEIQTNGPLKHIHRLSFAPLCQATLL